MEKGHSLLKASREKGERALPYLEAGEAEALKKETHGHMEQLKDLTSTVRKEHMALEKGLHLAKEFSDKYKALTQWVAEFQEILHTPEEPKMELYEKKAQLSKYKVVWSLLTGKCPRRSPGDKMGGRWFLGCATLSGGAGKYL